MTDRLSTEYMANAIAYRLNHYQATGTISIRTRANEPDGRVVATVTHADGRTQQFEILVSEML